MQQVVQCVCTKWIEMAAIVRENRLCGCRIIRMVRWVWCLEYNLNDTLWYWDFFYQCQNVIFFCITYTHTHTCVRMPSLLSFTFGTLPNIYMRNFLKCQQHSTIRTVTVTNRKRLQNINNKISVWNTIKWRDQT